MKTMEVEETTMKIVKEKPYVLSTPNEDHTSLPKGHLLGYDLSQRRTNNFIFYQGIKLDEEDYDLVLEWRNSEEALLIYDVVPSHQTPLIVTQPVLDVFLQICPNDFQYFPVSINGRDQQTFYDLIDFGEGVEKINFHRKGYYLINITNQVDAIDTKNSIPGKPSMDRGKLVWGFKKFVLKSGCMGKHHIARAKNLLGMELVSPTLAKELKKHNFNLLEFFHEDKTLVQF